MNDVVEIHDICAYVNTDNLNITLEEVLTAIQTLNKGKSADIFGLTAEHLLHGGDNLLRHVTDILQATFTAGTIPDMLKKGILSPVYKTKGSKNDAKNYRGITVTPVLSKLIEVLIRNQIAPHINASQNVLQRGFTAQSSSVNCALIVEEYLRECRDMNKVAYVAFLDAKAAFDVVSHPNLLRKLYNVGFEGKCWTMIQNLYQGASRVVKWNGLVSECFKIDQGVRQGGVLSSDLYKVYVNDLLNRICESGLGASIGSIHCAAPTCADDITLMSTDPDELQLLLDMSHDYSCMEQYTLQPTKSVILKVKRTAVRSSEGTESYPWKLGDDMVP